MPRHLRAHPVSEMPTDWTGWSGRTPQIRRIIATVHWTDGSVTEHQVFAHEWTRTHVRVIIESDHNPPRRTCDLWLPASDVRRNTGPPRLGECIPAPWRGPTWLVEATQEHIDAWHSIHDSPTSD
ncbi:hypothetical protein [Phytoactinopolyspora endophytica]|uniref:hypothetical protein n=1 Tax=Phytoactinopolyspora endophytica TaxID=1642495 RepID=UPI00101C72F6|nr:hypothetical protein [Phytoactinopolyspora endophytica]